MLIIESDRTAGAIQSIAAEILHVQVGVSQAGRLGNEINLGDGYDDDVIEQLRAALADGGHEVIVTRTTPRPVKRARSVKVSDELWDAASIKAEQRGEYLSEVIRSALERYAKRP